MRPRLLSPVVRLCLSVCLALALSATAAQADDTGFLDRRVGIDGVAYKYQVFVPPTWSPTSTARLPVILFLHGAGERGDDGLAQTIYGLPSAIRMAVERFPAIVVMPQCRKSQWWTSPAMQAVALRALDEAVREWNGDTTRIYLTGMSMGGYGTFDLAWKNPRLFAALAPVCGGLRRLPMAPKDAPFPADSEVDPERAVASAIGSTPIWIFHGAKDKTVPVEGSRRMAAALRAQNGRVQYTEYPEAGHDSWTAAYSDPAFATWLFSQRQTTPGPLPPRRQLADDGFVRDWLVLEPGLYRPVWPPGGDELRRTSLPHEADGRLSPSVGDEATVYGTKRAWKAISSSSSTLDLGAANGLGRDMVDVFAYAFAKVHVSRAIPSAVLRVGAKDMVRVHIGGKEILRAAEPRPFAPDQIAARVALKEGDNVLVIKAVNTEHEWHVSARFVDEDGRALDGVTVTMGPEKKPLDAEGFVRDWLVLGPFKFTFPPLARGQVDAQQIAGESQLKPQAGDLSWLNGHALAWRPWRLDGPVLNFNAVARLSKNAIGSRHADTHGGTLFNGITWAVSYVDTPTELRNVELRFAINDQGKVWLNGAEVVKNDVPGTLARPPQTAKVVLRKGRNVLILKSMNAGARWEGQVGLFDKSGRAVSVETGIEPPLPDFTVHRGPASAL